MQKLHILAVAAVMTPASAQAQEPIDVELLCARPTSEARNQDLGSTVFHGLEQVYSDRSNAVAFNNVVLDGLNRTHNDTGSEKAAREHVKQVMTRNGCNASAVDEIPTREYLAHDSIYNDLEAMSRILALRAANDTAPVRESHLNMTFRVYGSEIEREVEKAEARWRFAETNEQCEKAIRTRDEVCSRELSFAVVEEMIREGMDPDTRARSYVGPALRIGYRVITYAAPIVYSYILSREQAEKADAQHQEQMIAIYEDSLRLNKVQKELVTEQILQADRQFEEKWDDVTSNEPPEMSAEEVYEPLVEKEALEKKLEELEKEKANFERKIEELRQANDDNPEHDRDQPDDPERHAPEFREEWARQVAVQTWNEIVSTTDEQLKICSEGPEPELTNPVALRIVGDSESCDREKVMRDLAPPISREGEYTRPERPEGLSWRGAEALRTLNLRSDHCLLGCDPEVERRQLDQHFRRHGYEGGMEEFCLLELDDQGAMCATDADQMFTEECQLDDSCEPDVPEDQMFTEECQLDGSCEPDEGQDASQDEGIDGFRDLLSTRFSIKDFIQLGQ